jgi:hypothetical protein
MAEERKASAAVEKLDRDTAHEGDKLELYDDHDGAFVWRVVADAANVVVRFDRAVYAVE